MAEHRYLSAEVICFRCRVSAHPRCQCAPTSPPPRRRLMSALTLALYLGASALAGTAVGAAIALLY